MTAQLRRTFENLRISRALSAGALVPLSTPASLTQTCSPKVDVGTGYPDTNTRQVVRTSSGVVYIFVVAATLNTNNASKIHMDEGSPAGSPTIFTEVDAAHGPTNNRRFGGVEIRLDNTGNIQVLYEEQSTLQEKYVLFHTATDLWGADEVVAALPRAHNNRYESRTPL